MTSDTANLRKRAAAHGAMACVSIAISVRARDPIEAALLASNAAAQAEMSACLARAAVTIDELRSELEESRRRAEAAERGLKRMTSIGMPATHVPVAILEQVQGERDTAIARAAAAERDAQALRLLREIYGREENCVISSFWDGGWWAQLGDSLNGFRFETPDCDDIVDAIELLANAAGIANSEGD